MAGQIKYAVCQPSLAIVMRSTPTEMLLVQESQLEGPLLLGLQLGEDSQLTVVTSHFLDIAQKTRKMLYPHVCSEPLRYWNLSLETFENLQVR